MADPKADAVLIEVLLGMTVACGVFLMALGALLWEFFFAPMAGDNNEDV